MVVWEKGNLRLYQVNKSEVAALLWDESDYIHDEGKPLKTINKNVELCEFRRTGIK